jgi:hypothetical protein
MSEFTSNNSENNLIQPSSFANIENTPSDIIQTFPQSVAQENTPQLEIIATTNLPGVFTVGKKGEIELSYIADGGSYQGILAAFSLRDLTSTPEIPL